MRCRAWLWTSVAALVASGCMLDPRNGSQIANDGTFTFDGYALTANQSVDLYVRNQITPDRWERIDSTPATSAATGTDVQGHKWYAFSKAVKAPISTTKTRLWRRVSSAGTQRRIAADFSASSSDLPDGISYATFDIGDATTTCLQGTYQASGGLAAIEQCMSDSSPVARAYMNCGRADQFCCLSYQPGINCDRGRVCGATAKCTTASGGATQPCNDDKSCNSGLVCASDNTCVYPKTASTRWFSSFQSCDSNDPDCNMCAPNVKLQLDQAAGRDQWFNTNDQDESMNWDDDEWHFTWDRNYAPSGLDPNAVFGEHVGGFARTNRDPYRFIGAYSDDDGGTGGLLIIYRNPENHVKSLANIFAARHRHPSGVSTLGKYMVFSDLEDHVRLIDLERRNVNHTIDWEASGMKRAGGGLGITKLSTGNHLLVVSPSGSSDGSHREVRFYHLNGNLESPQVTAVGTWTYKQPISWSGDYRYTENLTVIPECGTGDIYVLNTTGDDSGGGRGYWLLSKVIQDKDQGGVSLAPIRTYFQSQDRNHCHQRSAATAWVSPTGKLELYCSERKSMNGLLDGNDDTVRFKTGHF